VLITFKKLRWRNFFSTGQAFTEIDFTNAKTTLIVGENGSGKTTFLDAFSFVNYGKPYRNINIPLLVNSINKRDLLVEEEFNIGDKEYLIRRGISPTLFEIYKDGSLIDQTPVKEYQKYLETTVLKMNYKSFIQLVTLGSSSFVPFMRLQPYDRRIIIENLLDIEIFSVMNVLLKGRSSKNELKIYELKLQENLLNEKIELNKRHLKALQQNSNDIISQKENKILEHSNTLSSINEKILESRFCLLEEENSIKDKKDILSKSAQLKEIHSGLNSKRSKSVSEVEFFDSNSTCPKCTQEITDDFKGEVTYKGKENIRQIDEAFEKLKIKEETNTSDLLRLSENEERIRKRKFQISNLEVEQVTYTRFINELNEEINKLKIKDHTIVFNTDQIKPLENQLVEVLKEKELAISQGNLYDATSTLLKDSGIKAKIVKQYIPVMNSHINKYLGLMDFACSFELNENFEEIIKSRHRDQFVYESFSEGEKLRIDLALLFTWRAICKLRNSVSTNVLVMDEILDRSLDQYGVESLLRLLDQIKENTKLFVISHRNDQISDKFERVLRFVKTNNFSRILEVLK